MVDRAQIYEESIKTGCEVTFVGCSQHNLIGPGFAAFLREHNLDPNGCSDAIIVPNGCLCLDTNELVRRWFKTELETSLSLHAPECVVLGDFQGCHHRRHSQTDRDREIDQAARTIQRWFPNVRILRYQTDRLEGLPTANHALLACIDWRNWPIISRYALEGYAMITMAGDFERLGRDASPDDTVQLIDRLKRAVEHMLPGEILLLGHLGCGWRGRTRGFTNDTDEGVQRATLVDSGLDVIRRLKPHFPKHRFSLAVSLTRGHAPSQGLDFLVQG